MGWAFVLAYLVIAGLIIGVFCAAAKRADEQFERCKP